jgi:hypothetical protein
MGLSGKPPSQILVEWFSLRGQIDCPGRWILRLDRFDGPSNGLYFHHHALTTSIRGIIHNLMFIRGKISDVNGSDLDEPFLNSFA